MKKHGTTGGTLAELMRQVTGDQPSDAEIAAALAVHGFEPDDRMMVNVSKLLPDHLRALARIEQLEARIKALQQALEESGL